MNILLVDDEQDILDSLANALELLQYNVEREINPVKALERVKEGSFDLVITDERMPNMTGMQLLKHIKRYNEKIPVIITTAYGDLESAIEYINNKVYAFFPKPIRFNKIVTTLRELEAELKEEQKGSPSVIDEGTMKRGIYDYHSEITNIIFRVFHAVEGTEGCLNYRTVQQVTHEAQTLLELLKNDEAGPDQKTVEWIYQAVDFIKQIIDTIEMNLDDRYCEEPQTPVIHDINKSIKNIDNEICKYIR